MPFCWLDMLYEQRHEGKIGDEKGCARNQPRFEAEWHRLCGMSGITGRLVVSPPPVRGMWAHRLL